MRGNARPVEVRLWWPLPLAVLVWFLIIWAFGFLLTATEQQTEEETPPIEARFIELPESDRNSEPTPPSSRGIEPQPETAEPTPAPPIPAPVPPARPAVKPQVAKKIASEKGLPQKQPTRQVESTQPTAPQSAPTDLSEYINQARARRQKAGIFDGQENIPPTAIPQPSDELRLARVKRNLQEPGTSGVFSIVEIRPRHARFTFRAWTTGTSPTRRVLIEVEAEPDGDIHRATIRRMIELIREYHQEDFNWESQRLNRVVVLSARLGDSEGLEDFLMREFFGDMNSPYSP